ASKSKWMQLLRKKWVLPAIYIAIAGFLLSAVIWYQSFSTRWLEGSDTNDQTEQSEETNNHLYNEDALDVLQQEETIKIPVGDGVQTEIFTKFFDYNASQEEQEKSLTLYNNRYYQSTGIDIVAS